MCRLLSLILGVDDGFWSEIRKVWFDFLEEAHVKEEGKDDECGEKEEEENHEN